MKKLFLFVAAASFALTSCSGDDDSGSGSGNGSDSVKFKVDGVEKTYNTVVVDEDTYTEDGETYTELTITASNGSSTEFITFEVDKGDVGSDAVYYTNYFAAGDSFYGTSPAFNYVVQTNNNDKKLKGTFSGTLVSNLNPETTKTVTDGTFNISY